MKKIALIISGVIILLAVIIAIVSFPPLFPKGSIDSLNASGTHIFVGYPFETSNYKTVQDAVNAAQEIDPKSESERVYIHIAPQNILAAPLLN